MTMLLERAVEAARTLPPHVQDEIARLVLQLAGADDQPPIELSAGERSAIEQSKAAAVNGEFASDDDIRGVWAKHGL
jgi:hypothetical protein